jgi:hypothetical protein
LAALSRTPAIYPYALPFRLCAFAPLRETFRTSPILLFRAKAQRRKDREANTMMTENEIAKHVVDAALKIHKRFGPGLLESVYEAVMAAELERRGLRVKRQQPIPVVYEDVRLDIGFRADLIVEDKVIV